MNVAARPFAPILSTLMVESITLRNFKGYSDCKIENLRRINLVVGDNGSGKTALLEALFLAAGATPELVLRARQWRGLEGAFSGSQDAVSEAIWADIFHLFRTNKSAYVGLKGKGEENRSVTVIMNAPGSIRVIPPPRDQSAKTPKQQSDLPPIEFKYEVQGLGIRTVVPSFTENGIRFNELPRSYVRSAFYAANQTAPGSEMASNFSTLSKRFDSARFSTLLHDLFPDIKNPSIEISAGQPLLFVTATGIPKRMPIGLASGGSNKLAAILLSIAVMEGGLVIVDEIENGLYYRRIPDIWRAIIKFAAEYNCQIFASSHSSECIRSLAEIAAESPDEYCMLRTVSSPTGTIVRYFRGQEFSDSILSDVEMR